MNDDSDTTLVLAARDGDKEAFAQLLTRHGGLVRALCQRVLTDPELVEDASQEAALQALLNLGELRQPERFGSWLGGIGLNVSRRWLRERSRAAWSWDALHDRRPESEWPDSQPGPDALAEAAELASSVRQAVASLPPGQQSAVITYYLAGLTQAETAEALGIEPGAVKTRLHRARQSLRRHLLATWEDQAMDEKLSRRTLTKSAGTLTGIAVAGHFGSVAASPREGATTDMSKGQTEPAFVEMRVVDVRRKRGEDGRPGTCAVILEEAEGGRRLPIWMGESEGTALAVHFEQVEVPRPLTYTFVANLLQASGGQLRKVHINRLVEHVYYAEAIIEGPDGIRAIDARPSDAINLALLANAPIFIEPAVLDTVAAQSLNADEVTARAKEGPGEIVAYLTNNLPQSKTR